MTHEGEAVILYTLRNDNGCEIQVCNIGATLVSVKSPDRNGEIADVILGYKDFESYWNDPACSGKSVGRVANRIAGGKMTVGGKDYNLETNNGPNHLHGGSHGFGTKLWESRVETNRVVFSLLSEDGDAGYPGEVAVEAAYDLDEDNNICITYVARSNALTPINLTNHTYWNLSGENSGDILSHELHLNCSNVLEMNEVQIPTGKLLNVEGTPMDFRSSFRRFADGIDSEFNHIKDFKGYDHFFVLDDWKQNILSEVGELRDSKSGRKVTVLSSQAGAMVYTGNWLEGGCPVTKSGGRYKDYAGVAIECQNYPDAINHDNFPSVLLNPDETYCQKIVFRMGTF
ncbi:MAG: galactose mutarotase [Alistipes sp.]|nr:galactose mutarotase [Alistipes sp.]